MSQENPGLANLTNEELYEHISLIPDQKVQDYLNNLESKLKTALPKQEALVVEIAEFLSSLGLKIEEAQQITKILVTSLYAKSVNDLKTISDENFNEIFLQINPSFDAAYPNFLQKLRVYFK